MKKKRVGRDLIRSFSVPVRYQMLTLLNMGFMLQLQLENTNVLKLVDLLRLQC